MYAQLRTDLNINSLTGYEYNVLKSPATFIQNGNLLGKDSLYKSSSFQRAGVKFVARKRWNKNKQLRLRINPIGQFYFNDSELNYYMLYTGFHYDYRFSNKTKWYNAIRFNIKDREGVNIDGSELNFPLGYKHFDVTSGLHFRLYKQNRTHAKLFYTNRVYNETEASNLSYNGIGGNLVFRNVFKSDKGYHSYGTELRLNNRFFKRHKVNNNTDETFRWLDFSSSIFYRLPVTKSLDVTPSFIFRNRKDSSADKFSFHQWRPALNLRYKNEVWNLDLTGSYVHRTYKTLKATNNQGTNLGALTYKYRQVNLEVARKLSKKLSLIGQGRWTTRISNKTNENAMFFRGYDYEYVGVGLRYIF